jgi:hypothetical protein
MHIVKVSKKTGLSLDRITNFIVLPTATSSTIARVPTQTGRPTLLGEPAGCVSAVVSI